MGPQVSRYMYRLCLMIQEDWAEKGFQPLAMSPSLIQPMLPRLVEHHLARSLAWQIFLASQEHAYSDTEYSNCPRTRVFLTQIKYADPGRQDRLSA